MCLVMILSIEYFVNIYERSNVTSTPSRLIAACFGLIASLLAACGPTGEASSTDETSKNVAGQCWKREQSADNVKANPTGANERPVIGRALNEPAGDLFVDPDACGQANRYDCGITDRSSNSQFAGERMNPSRKNRKHNTTQQCPHDHDRHVGVERVVGGLMEFNIGRYREARHCAPKPYPVDHQSTGG